MQSPRRLLALLMVLLLLGACSAQVDHGPVFHEEGNPELLSEWNILQIRDQMLNLSDRVLPFDLNSPLYTDHAHKLRTVWMPEGAAATYHKHESFEFPVGTVISKTFYYPIPAGTAPGGTKISRSADGSAQLLNAGFDLASVKLVETRLLIHRADGWVALPYVWNNEQSDAVLKRAGDAMQYTLVSDTHDEQQFTYVVPNANQCAGCHATNASTRAVKPVGPRARHLNKNYRYADGEKNQLVAWQEQGLLTGVPDIDSVPQNVAWDDTGKALNLRARSYLDINCSHCHNDAGAADTSGLFLEPDTPSGPALGICKLPIAAGTGTGGRKFGIVPGQPDESILLYRLESADPAVMMPELGRSTAHDAGVVLVREWIAKMDGDCS